LLSNAGARKRAPYPRGSIILNRQPSFWDLYKYYVLAAILVFLAQAIVIVALLRQRTRRKKAEAELIRSEEKFGRSFRYSPLAITITSANDCRYVDVNEAFERHAGWKRGEVIGRTPLEIGLWVNPDQRHVFLKQLLANGSVRDFVVRFRTKDGQTRTGLGSAEVIEVNGEQCALSVIADITVRKAAEEALSTVSRRLIEAQDAERTRIARELHDDINQRLALLRVSLTTLKGELPAAEARTGRQIDDACAKMADLANDIQVLSHRLHSSRLEYLGLDAASAGLCGEVAERQKIEIRIDCQGIPKDLSSDISFCLFRVLQEALQNAVKHSGATKIHIVFTGSLHEIKLMVRDFGVGFDPAITPIGHGLGLIQYERAAETRRRTALD
jgi:PAS domain S-box-containing protein